MEDKEIVTLYWEKDENAILETEKKYSRYLMKIAYNILADMEDSKESVNDTYWDAWKSIPPHRPIELSTYLAKITRRNAIDIFRKRNRKKRKVSEYVLSLEELGDCILEHNTPEQIMDTQLLAKAINDFLRTLSSDARNLFIGRYYFLDSLKDVAAYCGMSESKAKSMLYRTRCSLKDYLNKEGFFI